jgi:hypothetical protein
MLRGEQIPTVLSLGYLYFSRTNIVCTQYHIYKLSIVKKVYTQYRYFFLVHVPPGPITATLKVHFAKFHRLTLRLFRKRCGNVILLIQDCIKSHKDIINVSC